MDGNGFDSLFNQSQTPNLHFDLFFSGSELLNIYLALPVVPTECKQEDSWKCYYFQHAAKLTRVLLLSFSSLLKDPVKCLDEFSFFSVKLEVGQGHTKYFTPF